MINREGFCQLIHATLKDLEKTSGVIKYTPQAVDLLIMTAMHESAGLMYLRQIKGPALSYFQVEPVTHADIWVNYLSYRPKLAADVMLAVLPRRFSNTLLENVLATCSEGNPKASTFRMQIIEAFEDIDQVHEALVEDLIYSIVIARLWYFRRPGAIPHYQGDVKAYQKALSEYAKEHFNTIGKATPQKYLKDYLDCTPEAFLHLAAK